MGVAGRLDLHQDVGFLDNLAAACREAKKTQDDWMALRAHLRQVVTAANGDLAHNLAIIHVLELMLAEARDEYGRYP